MKIISIWIGEYYYMTVEDQFGAEHDIEIPSSIYYELEELMGF